MALLSSSMATLRASILSSCLTSRSAKEANLYSQRLKANSLVSKPPVKEIFNDLSKQNQKELQTMTALVPPGPKVSSNKTRNLKANNSKVVEELYAVMEVVADRAEMHTNLGIQRDNWNHLLLVSVNGMTATAALMAGVATIGGHEESLLALKLSSTLLYMAVTGALMVMNKIQPCQLAEEQRNAARLCRQLHEQIRSTIILNKKPTSDDVEDAMEKVLALDNAYPLPLLGTMLNKFPKRVEPAVWWPKHVESHEERPHRSKGVKNGWNKKLEEEMKEVLGVLRRRDTAEYVRLGKKVLRVNKVLAILGPLLTGLAGVGSAFLGSPRHDSWAVLLAIASGALATVVNTLEHGGQVGMVFEMYRGSAGFFRLLEESIDSALNETDADKRENGEVLEAKLALELGRSLSELRDLASHAAASKHLEAEEEFASNLF